jgi:predicted TIM-barrel fold metal-dependent hydrolase
MKAGITIVDADGHVSDRASIYRPYLEPPHNLRNEREIYPGDGFDRLRGATGGRNPENVADMLADMDVEGIDTMVVFPTLGLNLGMIREREYAAALARAYNNWVYDFRKGTPDRLQAVAILPLMDIGASVRELERAAGELGVCGAMVHTEVSRQNVGDEAYWPLYATAQRLGLPICFHAHGSGSPDSYRWRNFLGAHTWSHLPEQLITAASVAYGGVLEKFQDLKVAFLEAGCGWIPFWMEHLDEEWEKRKFDAPLCIDRPSRYLGNGRCWVSCEPEEKTISYVADWIGEDQIIYASDYPHWDGGWPTTVDTILKRDDLSDPLKRKILGENAMRFYGLTVRAPAPQPV